MVKLFKVWSYFYRLHLVITEVRWVWDITYFIFFCPYLEAYGLPTLIKVVNKKVTLHSKLVISVFHFNKRLENKTSSWDFFEFIKHDFWSSRKNWQWVSSVSDSDLQKQKVLMQCVVCSEDFLMKDCEWFLDQRFKIQIKRLKTAHNRYFWT